MLKRVDYDTHAGVRRDSLLLPSALFPSKYKNPPFSGPTDGWTTALFLQRSLQRFYIYIPYMLAGPFFLPTYGNIGRGSVNRLSINSPLVFLILLINALHTHTYIDSPVRTHTVEETHRHKHINDRAGRIAHRQLRQNG